MPGMRARDPVDRLPTGHADTAVICTSSDTDDAIPHRGVLDAGVHVLSTPYTIADLTHRVREVMDS